jgi:hypothetical protein
LNFSRLLVGKLSQRKAQKWIWLGAAALVLLLLQVYYVQEMIAALFIFSIAFVAVCMVLLVIFLLDRASQRTAAWAEPGAARVAQVARRGVAVAEVLARKHTPSPAEEPRQ